MSSDDDLPSLEEIFSRPINFKRAKVEVEIEDENIENNENNKRIEKATVKAPPKTLEKKYTRSELKVNTPVFVDDRFNHTYSPGIILKERNPENNLYTVKLYDGRVEILGRNYIFIQDDPEFFSINAVPLKQVAAAENSMIRKFNEEFLFKIIEQHEDELKGVLCGDLKSQRDTIFRADYCLRSSLNSGNIPGPFTTEEYSFLIGHVPKVVVPYLLEKHSGLREKLEKRFGVDGKALDHELRQYSYVVLVPELTARYVLALDKSLNSVEEAFEKLLTNSKSFDIETGNFIDYLYSSQDMYRIARREWIE